MPSATPVSDTFANNTIAKKSSGSLVSEAPMLKNIDLGESAKYDDIQHTKSENTSSSSSIEDDSLLAVAIEDTPVQYACRVTLALQIMEFVVRSKSTAGRTATIDVEKEKQIVADTLRLPQSIFPAR
ncbi:hypothetical protein COEREDRAFT_7361 [Coemansia reversa NRRL 1564]|uniref:Uncharacterized protein n=1 Tax=Coemansia reversa (strain ATCC 12441 / NRRL 1564) TaxID=763665 RepID=A0A2G5BEF6_COERN|nr:hypothetical protein COEREDRAFT_7361 [Coemansia reversa NRRL 1564]|eukprot:PIA17395.1 hypothetical protein COEREDRAFT_7361 [Coemansia reversa NRRL 1564]